MARPAAGPARRGQVFGGADVVLRRPRTLISSSPGTTSDGRIGVRNRMAWCLTARKPLFLRRGAPRHWPWSSLRRSRRGASLPAIPCFFVEGHHAIGPGRAFGGAGVVPHCPLSLVSSSRGTTPLALVEPSEEPAWCLTALNPLFLRRRAPRPGFPPTGQFREPAPGSRNSHLPKKRKMSAKVLLPQHLADISLSPINQ